MTTPSVLTRTAHGAGWAVGWRVTTRILGLANTFVLVRLLAPEDFGLVALATGFSQAILQLSELGMEDALVRDPAPTRELFDTAFTVNMMRGLGTALVVAGLAWPAAWFFRDDRLVPALLVLAGCTAVSAFDNIGIVEFRREFRFSKEFQLKIAPRLATIAVVVVAASVWRSYWALLLGLATAQALSTAMSYAMHPFRARLSLAAWHRLAAFSVWSWAISLASILRERVDGFVIGRVLGLTDVGLYSVGTEVGFTPTYELGGAIGRASLPGFAAARRTEAGAVDAYLRILGTVMLLAVPAGVGISLVADQVVPLYFGQQWIDAVLVVRVVGIAGITFAINQVTRSFLAAHALLQGVFSITIIAFAVRVVAMLLLVPRLGISGALAALALTLIVEDSMYVGYTFRRFHIPASAATRRIWRTLIASTAMAAALWAGGLGWSDPAGGASLGILSEAVALGAAVFTASLLLLWAASGRPLGAEADLIELARRMAGGVLRRVRAVRG